MTFILPEGGESMEFIATDGCGGHHWVFLKRRLIDSSLARMLKVMGGRQENGVEMEKHQP